MHHVVCTQRESLLMDEELLCSIAIDDFGENLQVIQEALLRPYVWLYETLNDERTSCQAHGGIHPAFAPS